MPLVTPSRPLFSVLKTIRRINRNHQCFVPSDFCTILQARTERCLNWLLWHYFLLFFREERKGDDAFNCTAYNLPANCTAKYTSPSAEFWTWVNIVMICSLYSLAVVWTQQFLCQLTTNKTQRPFLLHDVFFLIIFPVVYWFFVGLFSFPCLIVCSLVCLFACLFPLFSYGPSTATERSAILY